MAESAWHACGNAAELREGELAVHVVAGWQVLVTRGERGLVALNDRCPHQASRLSGGRIRRGAIMCPLHGARFDLGDGRCIGAAYPPLRLFPCRERDGVIEVFIPNTPPSLAELPGPF